MKKGSFEKREKDFKKGITLESATEKRRNGQISLRKKKKDLLMRQRRQQTQQQTSGLKQLLNKYKKEAVLQNENFELCVEHVKLLCYILNVDEGEPSERYLRQLFCVNGKPVVLDRLLKLFNTDDKKQEELVETISWCLSSLSGTKNDGLLWNNAIYNAGFVDFVHHHIGSENHDLRDNCWAILLNMCLAIDNMRFVFEQTNIPKICKSQMVAYLSSGAAAPSEKEHGSIKWLMIFLCAYLEKGEGLPPWQHVVEFFPVIVSYIQMVPLINFKAMLPDQQEWFSLALACINAISFRCDDIDLSSLNMLLGKSNLLELLIEKAKHIEHVGYTNFRRCIFMISEYASLDPEFSFSTQRIIKADGLQVLSRAIMTNTKEIQQYAVLAMALMVQDSVDVVFELVKRGTMVDICKNYKHWQMPVRKNVAILFCNMIQILYPNSKTNSADRLDQRNSTFAALVNRYNCISIMCDFLRQGPGGQLYNATQTMETVISALSVALFWREAMVKKRLEECGGLTSIQSLGSHEQCTTELFEKTNRLLERFYDTSNPYDDGDDALFDSNVQIMDWGAQNNSAVPNGFNF